jgi:2'-5' RNA ligase
VRTSGLSLWLVPEPEARRRLAGTISELAGRLGSPAFEPHVTLLGHLAQPEPDVVAAAVRLASATTPLQLRPFRVGQRDEYFRCLFYEIAADAALIDLHMRARLALGRSDEALYFPHLSLVYGELDNAAKEELAGPLAPRRGERWRVDELQVVRTDGEAGEWRLLAGFPLSRRD